MRSIGIAALASALAGCAPPYHTPDEFGGVVDGWALRGRPLVEAVEQLEAEGFRCPADPPNERRTCERTARTYFCAQWQTLVLVDDGQGRVARVETSVRGGLRPLAC